MKLHPGISPFLLLGLLAACSGVETGTVSPCHGQFRAYSDAYMLRTDPDPERVRAAMAFVENFDAM